MGVLAEAPSERTHILLINGDLWLKELTGHQAADGVGRMRRGCIGALEHDPLTCQAVKVTGDGSPPVGLQAIDAKRVDGNQDNAPAAQQLVEWLASAQAQTDFAGMNLEYPANPAVEAVPAVAAWGRFKPNLINVNEAGRLQATAVKLMDRAGYY